VTRLSFLVVGIRATCIEESDPYLMVGQNLECSAAFIKIIAMIVPRGEEEANARPILEWVAKPY
jgi:hypothetical protein